MMTRTRGFTLIIFVATFLMTGCYSLTTKVHDSNPPQFSFSAGQFAECCTNLAFLAVWDVTDEKRRNDVVLWQIWPHADNSANALATITYGIVPAHWVQTIPAHGAPPPLVEGRIYAVGGPPIEVPRSYIMFVIRDGKTIQVR